MGTHTLPHNDLFDALASAMLAVEFGHLTGDESVTTTAIDQIRSATAEALARGYILTPDTCSVGDEVQNLHGDTGTILSISGTPVHPRIEVRWDAPSPHRVVFDATALSAGELRHRR